MTRMIEVNGRRFWLVSHRNGSNMQALYYTTGYGETGKTIMTESAFNFGAHYTTPEQALDAAETYVRQAEAK